MINPGRNRIGGRAVRAESQAVHDLSQHQIQTARARHALSLDLTLYLRPLRKRKIALLYAQPGETRNHSFPASKQPELLVLTKLSGSGATCRQTGFLGAVHPYHCGRVLPCQCPTRRPEPYICASALIRPVVAREGVPENHMEVDYINANTTGMRPGPACFHMPAILTALRFVEKECANYLLCLFADLRHYFHETRLLIARDCAPNASPKQPVQTHTITMAPQVDRNTQVPYAP